MGAPVPADDLPGAIVPADDLPEPEAADVPEAPPDPTLIDKVKGTLRSLLPATRSPIGAALNYLTGGGYGDVAPQYDALSPPPRPELAQLPGESDRDYAFRAVRSGRFDTPDEGLALVGMIGGGGALKGKMPAPPVGPSALKRTANSLAASTLKGTAGEYKSLGASEVQQLGDWLLRNKAVRPLDTTANVAERLGPMKGAAVQRLEAALKELDATGAVGLDKVKLRDAFLDAAVEESKRGPASNATVEKYLNAARDIEERIKSEPPTGTFSEGEQWKRGYQDVAYPKGRAPIDPSPGQVADMDIAAIARRHIEDAADQAAQGSGAAERFVEAKKDYGAARTAERLTTGAEARAEARNLASPSDKAAALATLATTANPAMAIGVGAANNLVRTRAASTLATGADWLARRRTTGTAGASGPPIAAAEIRGVPTPQPPRELPRAAENDRVPQKTIEKLTRALKSNPGAFGEHAAKLQAAAERGPEALAAAHYVLSLDPGSGYRARAAQVLETPDEQFATETTP